MAFYICTSLPLQEKEAKNRSCWPLCKKKLFQSICSRRGTVFYRVMPKKIVLLICRWKKNPHASGFSSVLDFYCQAASFLSSFFSSQRFSPLTLHSAADSQLCFFSRTGFFLSSAHTLFYRFLEVKFCCPLLHCRLFFLLLFGVWTLFCDWAHNFSHTHRTFNK